MNRPEMREDFLLSLNESANDSFSDKQIALFLTKAEVSVYNQAYGNYKRKQTEQQVPPNSYQETQYGGDLLTAFEVRQRSLSLDIRSIDQFTNTFSVEKDFTEELSHYKNFTVADTVVAGDPLNDGTYTIVSLNFDSANKVTNVVVAENIPNPQPAGQIKLLIPDRNSGFLLLPKDTQHITQLGAKTDSGKIIPVTFARFNDLNVLGQNEFTKPIYDDINQKFNVFYITENKKTNSGIAIFPNSIFINIRETKEYSLIIDYLTFPIPIIEADLDPSSTATSQFPENIHAQIVKEAVSLYLLSVSDPSFSTEQAKINSGAI